MTREHHQHFGKWIIYWDDRTDDGFRFWFSEPIEMPSIGSLNTALHHIGMYPTVADGLNTCEQLISDIISSQVLLTYRRVSEYHHRLNPPTATDTGNTDDIPL